MNPTDQARRKELIPVGISTSDEENQDGGGDDKNDRRGAMKEDQ
jgi:hypothetical protein